MTLKLPIPYMRLLTTTEIQPPLEQLLLGEDEDTRHQKAY